MDTQLKALQDRVDKLEQKVIRYDLNSFDRSVLCDLVSKCPQNTSGSTQSITSNVRKIYSFILTITGGGIPITQDLPSGWSVTSVSTGVLLVTHNLGLTVQDDVKTLFNVEYNVGSPMYFAQSYFHQANDFRVQFSDSSGAPSNVNRTFSVIVTVK